MKVVTLTLSLWKFLWIGTFQSATKWCTSIRDIALMSLKCFVEGLFYFFESNSVKCEMPSFLLEYNKEYNINQSHIFSLTLSLRISGLGCSYGLVRLILEIIQQFVWLSPSLFFTTYIFTCCKYVVSLIICQGISLSRISFSLQLTQPLSFMQMNVQWCHQNANKHMTSSGDFWNLC